MARNDVHRPCGAHHQRLSLSAPILLFLFALAAVQPARAAIVEETVKLPVDVAGAQGQRIRHPVTVTIWRDDALAKAPFIILNHGRSGKADVRKGMGRARFTENSKYLVGLGYVVIVPTRIGYGVTGGPDVENSGACKTKEYVPVYEAGTELTRQVIEYAKARPYVDPSRGIVMGQSFGGTIAIAIAAKGIPGIRGAINLAGGGGGRPETHPHDPCRPDLMGALFAGYGQTARIPTLWLYSENDRYWGPELPRMWLKSFTDAGGAGTFVSLPPHGDDGHSTFTQNTSAWRPPFEAFLASCCAPDDAKRTTAKAGVGAAIPPAATNVDTFSTALKAWADRHRVRAATIVVRRDGRIVHEARHGGADPAAPVHLASLSKPITGTCVAALIRDRKLTLDTPVANALAKFFRAHGNPADRRARAITVAELLTHRSGLAGAEDGDDAATGSVLKAHLTAHSPREARTTEYLKAVLRRPLARDAGQRYSYSNANYLVLGAVIEEASGRPYEDYCREAVLIPAGAKGTLDPTWRVMGPYGGWRLSGRDYLAFFETFDVAGGRLGPELRTWMLASEGKTYGKAKPPIWYGPGIRLRQDMEGVVVWHGGQWGRTLPPDDKGPLSTNFNTLAMRMPDGTSWFVWASPSVSAGARTELDRELLAAYRKVTRWQ